MAKREFSEKTLTAEVLKRVGKAKDKRTRQVMQSLVKHLHAFVREVRPTQEEWFQGIQFLTKTGHMCDDKRQEFILMSDTLGVSMLVDFLNYGKLGNATESTVLGPFFVDGAPELDRVSRFWNAPNLARTPGLKAVDLFEAARTGQLKALWVMGTNPAVSMPDAGRVREALSRVDFLVVSDVTRSRSR